MLRVAHFALVLLGVIHFGAQAQAHHHDHDHDHDNHAHDGHSHNPAAHQHGVGHLNLVLDGSQLMIELHTPAEDLLGFEHAPRTPEQRARTAELQVILKQPEKLFALPPAARCSLASVELHSSLFAGPPQAAPEPAGQHADIQAHYQFSCAAVQHLQQLDVTLFQQFPGSQRLLLQAITPNGQYGDELSVTHHRIRL